VKLGPIKLALTPPPMVIEAWTHKTSLTPSPMVIEACAHKTSLTPPPIDIEACTRYGYKLQYPLEEGLS
jgi:hypothetical protein